MRRVIQNAYSCGESDACVTEIRRVQRFALSVLACNANAALDTCQAIRKIQGLKK